MLAGCSQCQQDSSGRQAEPESGSQETGHCSPLLAVPQVDLASRGLVGRVLNWVFFLPSPSDLGVGGEQDSRESHEPNNRFLASLATEARLVNKESACLVLYNAVL